MKALSLAPFGGADGILKNRAPHFRVRLLITLMVVVVSVTAVALYFAERDLQARYAASSHDEFESHLNFLLGAAKSRQATVSERCRSLARGVRIRTAMEEDDREDLYLNGRIELRDVLLNPAESSPVPVSGETAKATFFRFLNTRGEVLPTEEGTPLQAWEQQLSIASAGLSSQQVGYIFVPNGNGSVINEIVSTPIFGPDGATLGALVLGFAPLNFAGKTNGLEIRNGMLIGGQLLLPSLGQGDSAALSKYLSRKVEEEGKVPSDARPNLIVEVQGEPNLLFNRVLNPGSSYPAASQVSLYSLVNSLAQQKTLRWNIIVTAAAVLAAGLLGSHFLSLRLARPVEQLAVDSAENLVLREQAETAQKQSEQKYQSIFENAVEGIFLLSPGGHYLSANPAFARIHGYASAEEALSDFEKKAPQSNCSELLRQLEKAGAVTNLETQVCRRYGEKIWISQNARGVRDAAGALLHIEGTLEDVTERKRSADAMITLNADLEKALAELKASQQQIIQQERLRALGQMASGIAHDFNNALMPIMGYTELLIEIPDVLDNREKTREYLEIIRTGANDAASVVGRLREFYRSNETGAALVPVDLKQLASQVVALTRPKWKDQAQAHGAAIQILSKLDDVPAIAGEEAALREVLTNLVFNAVDAMPDGGSITLRTRTAADRVIIEVADTGSGMTEEVRTRCLEPFFSTKGERGTGLGLAMVFGIVQRHSGQIDIKSTPGIGTTFIASFPIREVVSVQEHAVQNEKTQSPLRILVVEDEPQIRDVLSNLLGLEGHALQTAENGVEGLRYFRAGNFDLVITDKAMPGMSGDQMALAIKQVSPTMPVILISGFNSNLDNEHIPGVDVVAGKPITLSALRSSICQAMELAA